MPPHHILSAVQILNLDIAHHLEKSFCRAIGAAIFTGSVESGEVEFQLEATILSPSDHIAALLAWLDTRIDRRATIAGYGLRATAASLAASSGNCLPSITEALAGHGRQPILEVADDRRHRGCTSFAAACEITALPCSSPNAGDDFVAWMTGRSLPLIHQLELDAIALWRMAMARISATTALGKQVNAAIEDHLIDWLRATDFPAGQRHLGSLLATND